MSRFNLDFSVTGNAPQELDKISNSLGKVASQAEVASKGLKGAGDGTKESVDKMGDKTAWDRVKDGIQDAHASFSAFTHSVINHSKEWVKSIVEDAATFEDSQADMRFAFGKDWENVYQQVLDDSARLTFSFKEVSDLASSLGRMKINPFGGTDAASQLFKSRTGENIRALDALQDMADATGKKTDDLIAAIRNAVSGNWRSLKDRFDLPNDMIERMKSASKGGKDLQATYNAIVTEGAKMFGGAGLLKADNWNKITSQLPDLLQQMRAAAGGDGLKVMTAGVKDLVGALSDLVRDKEAMKSLADGFKLVAQALTFGIRLGADFVRWIHSVISFAPWLPKLAAGVGLVTVAATGLLFVLSTIGTTLLAIGATIAAIGWPVIAGALLGMVTMAPMIALLAVYAAGFALAMKAGSDVILSHWGGSDGVFTLFEKGKTLFEAFGEVFDTFNGTTASVSVETAEKLKKMGLWEFFLRAEAFIFKANEAWETFTDTVDELGTVVGPTFIPMLEEMGDLFMELADALGISTSLTKASEGTVGDWTDTARQMALMLGEIAKGAIWVTRVMVGIGRVAIPIVKDWFHWFEKVWHIIGKIADTLTGGGLGKAFSYLSDKLGTGAKEHTVNGKKLWHDDAVVEKDPLSGLRKSMGKDMNTGVSGFNEMSPENKQKFIQEQVDAGNMSQEDAARLMRGRAVRPKAKEGMDFEEFYAARQDGTNVSRDPRLQPENANTMSSYTPINQSMSPNVQPMTAAHAEKLISSVGDLKNAMMSMKFEADGQSIGKVVNNQNESSTGR